MKSESHQNFLGKYSLPDEHFSYEEAPLEYVGHPKATPEMLTKGAKDPRPYVRGAVMRHPKATPEMLTKGAKDPHPYVREAVMEHPNATPEILAMGAKDPHEYVRRAAKEHKNYK